jgi:hypothetical protein
VFERHPAIIPTIVCEKGRNSRRTEELHGRGHIAEPSWQPAAWHAGDEGVDVHQLAQSAAHEDPAIRMRAISSNVSEVLAARLSVYDSVGCDVRLPIAYSWSPFPYPRSWRERIEAPRHRHALPDILPDDQGSTSRQCSCSKHRPSRMAMRSSCSSKAPNQLCEPLGAGARPVHPILCHRRPILL